MPPATTVLDASALLAYVQDEDGADEVETALEKGCAISSVNLAEVLSKLAEAGADPAQALGELETLGEALQIEPMDEMDAVRVASLRSRTKAAGLSLADRACLALAERLGLPVLTADRDWKNADVDVEVVFLR